MSTSQQSNNGSSSTVVDGERPPSETTVSTTQQPTDGDSAEVELDEHLDELQPLQPALAGDIALSTPQGATLQSDHGEVVGHSPQ